MNQEKIGLFLKELRKEKNITQETLAEKLNVSGRTISRWETRKNMPDISLLVDLAEFYQVSIPEIIDGERKSESMNQETKEAVIKIAEYSKNEVNRMRIKTISNLFIIFGLFVIISALTIFPTDSSWGSIYCMIGGLIFIAGNYLSFMIVFDKRSTRILSTVLCAIILFGMFIIGDYIAVAQFRQVPRFSYETTWDSQVPNQLVHKTLFYTVIQKNPGTEFESVEIVK